MAHADLRFSRRDFLLATGGMIAFAPACIQSAPSLYRRQHSVIQIILTGGPSAQETFDPKPHAPDNSRGPFKPIPTRVPGLFLSEILPNLAVRANRFSLVRTLFHEHPPIHEYGLQLLQTGRIFDDNSPSPHLAQVLQSSDPSWLILPKPIGDTGVPLATGQPYSSFSPNLQPHGVTAIDPRLFADVAESSFDRCCRAAAQAVRAGTRFVTINMFNGVFDQMSWDMHASSKRLWVSPGDYRDTIGPMFDRAFSSLLDDLASDGALEQVLVVASGEMGRAPIMNTTGGRDHWTRSWPALVAGGGMKTGVVIGRTDDRGGEPIERPIPCEEIHALMAKHLGMETGFSCDPLPELAG